jgi:hypothetical protein
MALELWPACEAMRRRARQAAALRRLEDRLGRRGADPADPDRTHPQHIVERSNPARGLDLDRGGAVGPHQAQVAVRRPGIVVLATRLLYEPVAGRGLDEGDPDLRADHAELHDLVVGQEVILENNLEDRAVRPAGVIHLLYIVGDVASGTA